MGLVEPAVGVAPERPPVAGPRSAGASGAAGRGRSTNVSSAGDDRQHEQEHLQHRRCSVSTSICRYFASTSLLPASISTTNIVIAGGADARCAAAPRGAAARSGAMAVSRRTRASTKGHSASSGEDDARHDHRGQEQLADRVAEERELPVGPQAQQPFEPPDVEVGLRRRRRRCRARTARRATPG